MQNRRNEQRKRERVRGKAASMHLAVGKEMRPDKKKKKKKKCDQTRRVSTDSNKPLPAVQRLPGSLHRT